jgi:hypothetical protein
MTPSHNGCESFGRYLLSGTAKICGKSGRIIPVQYSPVRFHDFSYLPLPRLRREMLAAAVDTHLLRSVLEACRRSPGQRKTGETVLASLQAREVCQLLKSRQFSDCGELKGDWLAGLQDDDKRLQSLAACPDTHSDLVFVGEMSYYEFS